MPKTYYDSELTAEQIEDALTAIDGVVNPGNNGKVLYIEDGKIKAASASRWSGSAVLEPLSVTANGDYTPPTGTDGFDSVHVAVPSATLTTKSITQNGTYNASSDNADGYSSVTVNVSGGGDIGLPEAYEIITLDGITNISLDKTQKIYFSDNTNKPLTVYAAVKLTPWPNISAVCYILNSAYNSSSGNSCGFFIGKRSSDTTSVLCGTINGRNVIYKLMASDMYLILAYSIDSSKKISFYIDDGSTIDFNNELTASNWSSCGSLFYYYNGLESSTQNHVTYYYLGVVSYAQNDSEIRANITELRKFLPNN